MRRVIWAAAINEVLPDVLSLPIQYELPIVGVVLDALVEDDWAMAGAVHYEATVDPDGLIDVLKPLPDGVMHLHAWAGINNHVLPPPVVADV